jgi:hypothetical protein
VHPASPFVPHPKTGVAAAGGSSEFPAVAGCSILGTELVIQ